jgi:hypothetical protein
MVLFAQVLFIYYLFLTFVGNGTHITIVLLSSQKIYWWAAESDHFSRRSTEYRYGVVEVRHFQRKPGLKPKLLAVPVRVPQIRDFHSTEYCLPVPVA